MSQTKRFLLRGAYVLDKKEVDEDQLKEEILKMIDWSPTSECLVELIEGENQEPSQSKTPQQLEEFYNGAKWFGNWVAGRGLCGDDILKCLSDEWIKNIPKL